MRIRDYRTFLKGIGRRPLPKNLRTSKRPGDIEIVHAGGGRYERYVHGEEEMNHGYAS